MNEFIEKVLNRSEWRVERKKNQFRFRLANKRLTYIHNGTYAYMRTLRPILFLQWLESLAILSLKLIPHKVKRYKKAIALQKAVHFDYFIVAKQLSY